MSRRLATTDVATPCFTRTMTSAGVEDVGDGADELGRHIETGDAVVARPADQSVSARHPRPDKATTAEALLERCRHLPDLDPVALRRDIDAVFDTKLS